MFLLFGGDDYYAGGGMADFRGRFESIEDAVRIAENSEFNNSWSSKGKCEWWAVVDAKTLEIVQASDERAWWEEVNKHTSERLKSR